MFTLFSGRQIGAHTGLNFVERMRRGAVLNCGIVTLNAIFLISKIRKGKKERKNHWYWRYFNSLLWSRSVGQKTSWMFSTVHYFFIMPVGFNLNLTYGLKLRVNSIKIVSVYRRSTLQVENHYTTRTAPRFVCSKKLSPVQRSSYLDGWPNTNTPRWINFFFSPFLSKAILKTAELSALSDVVSSFSQLFFPISPCPHSRVFIYNIVKINSRTRRSNSSQFSWLLIVQNNNFDLIAICRSVKTLLSPLQSKLWNSTLNSPCLFCPASPQIIP